MIHIYTDGACRGNGNENNYGAYAFIVVENDEEVTSKSAAIENTTNNIMELQGTIAAIEWALLTHRKEITIVTDSTYVQKGISEWIHKWQQNGWKNAKKEPVKNKDLWVYLDTLRKQIKVQFDWCKGHADIKWNVEVDKLCNHAMDNYFKKGLI